MFQTTSAQVNTTEQKMAMPEQEQPSFLATRLTQKPIPVTGKPAREYPVAFKFEIASHGARAPHFQSPSYKIERDFKLGP